ncbi:MAG: hypothetical protein Q4C26_09420 [Bacteroidales bacterium]|nr:hypothetical protein [Bacteroidales bacterium]
MKGWKPSQTELKKIIDKYNNSNEYEHYREEDKALELTFRDKISTNDNITNILIKVSLLNDFYSTNIFKTLPVAKHILDLDIDKRLNKGDLELVNDIAKIDMPDNSGNTIKKYFYSFATKYCCNHRPDVYPIFDKFVEKAINKFIREDLLPKGTEYAKLRVEYNSKYNFKIKDYKIENYRKEDLKDYPTFYNYVMIFREHYNLDCSVRDLDRYLWIHGKDVLS